MGLHQKITDGVTAEPCDCGADDDHSAVLMDNPVAIQELFDEHSEPTDAQNEAEVLRQEEYRDETSAWTDGNE